MTQSPSQSAGSAAWKAYYMWLQDRGQIWPTASTKQDDRSGDIVAESTPSGPERLRVGFVCSMSNDQERVLLQKMLGAMQMAPSDFEVSSSSIDLLLRDPLILVFLGDEPGLQKHASDIGLWHDVKTPSGSVTVIKTHHPADLIKTPGLKREAWTHLQSVMEILQK